MIKPTYRYPFGRDWLAHTYTVPPTVFAAAPAATSSQSLRLQFDGQSFFIMLGLIAQRTGIFTTMMRKNNTAYMSGPITDQCLWGTNTIGGGGGPMRPWLPHWLPRPIIMRPSTEFFFDVVNTSGAPNTIALNAIGIRCFDLAEGEKLGCVRADNRLTKAPVEWYSYVLNQVVGAAARMPQTVQVLDFGGDFIAQQLMGVSTAAFSFQMMDTGMDRANWQDNFVSSAMGLGGAELPATIHPRRVKRNSSMTFDLRDDSGAPNTIQIVVEGYHEQPLA